MRLGALEAGGTKMVCAVGNETGEIFEQISIPTETPEITMPKLIAYFKDKQVDALGIGCFGPVELDRQSPEYGHITTTPKLAWRNYDIVGAFREALGCPVGFDTDVNGSVLGEVTFGQAKGKKCVIYLTIGTGVGGGIIVNNNLLKGKSGAAGEMHFKMSIERKRPCTCGTFDCFEAYTSGRGLALTYKDILNRDLTTYQIIENAKNNDCGDRDHLCDCGNYGKCGANFVFEEIHSPNSDHSN